MTELLAPDTSMGTVTLRVADLDRMIRFYRDGVTLDVLSLVDGVAVLGRGERELLRLVHSPELRHASPRSAGLYHTAVLFDTRAALATAVLQVARLAPGSFTGSADHLVSEAFYFDDPEGNGVELYFDRDRSTWSWTHGSIEMATLRLDPNTYLREHLTPEALELAERARDAGGADAGDGPASGAGSPARLGDATIGHVHLSVGDVASAREFYVNRLGFEATASIGDTALFVSAGGYHHHMAMNTWESRGAGRRALALGLATVDIVVPTADDLGELTERMRHYGVTTRDDGRVVAFDDPWSNAIEVRAAAA